MFGAYRIDGLAIVSVEGNIADHTGYMPNSLKLEADQALYAKALADAAVVVHGKLSHEGGSNSSQRRRLVMTRRVANLSPVEGEPNARYWNPAGAGLAEALSEVGAPPGTIGVLGGTDIYSHFLAMGYRRLRPLPRDKGVVARRRACFRRDARDRAQSRTGARGRGPWH